LPKNNEDYKKTRPGSPAVLTFHPERSELVAGAHHVARAGLGHVLDHFLGAAVAAGGLVGQVDRLELQAQLVVML
jgi:hypothetical protein